MTNKTKKQMKKAQMKKAKGGSLQCLVGTNLVARRRPIVPNPEPSSVSARIDRKSLFLRHEHSPAGPGLKERSPGKTVS